MSAQLRPAGTSRASSSYLRSVRGREPPARSATLTSSTTNGHDMTDEEPALLPHASSSGANATRDVRVDPAEGERLTSAHTEANSAELVTVDLAMVRQLGAEAAVVWAVMQQLDPYTLAATATASGLATGPVRHWRARLNRAGYPIPEEARPTPTVDLYPAITEAERMRERLAALAANSEQLQHELDELEEYIDTTTESNRRALARHAPQGDADA